MLFHLTLGPDTLSVAGLKTTFTFTIGHTCQSAIYSQFSNIHLRQEQGSGTDQKICEKVLKLSLLCRNVQKWSGTNMLRSY